MGECGHIVTILAPEGNGPAHFPTKANIIWINAKGGLVKQPNFSSGSLYGFKFMRAMAKAVRGINNEFDVILLNHSLTVFPAIIAGARNKSFYYVQLHEPEAFMGNSSLYMKMLGLVLWSTYYLIPKERCFVNSSLYVGYKGINSSAPIIPPGIDLDLYWKKDFKCFQKPINIGVIASKSPWKGTMQALDAFKKLVGTGLNAKLTVAFGHNLPEESLVGIMDHVEVVAPENDQELADFYRSVDIMFALATIQHGAPHYPVLESMACGTLVITTGYFPADQETERGDEFAPDSTHRQSPRALRHSVCWCRDFRP